MNPKGGYKGKIHAHLTGRPGAKAQGPVRSAMLVQLPLEYREPDAAEMAVNLAHAASEWIAAGFPLVSQVQYDERGAICAPCEYWSESGNFMLGKCKAPGCGCTKFKRWLATEVCKHPQGSKWPALPASI